MVLCAQQPKVSDLEPGRFPRSGLLSQSPPPKVPAISLAFISRGMTLKSRNQVSPQARMNDSKTRVTSNVSGPSFVH